MKVAVLGCSGGMGSYFVRRLLAEGHVVTGYDVVNRKQPKELILRGSNKGAAKDADVVLLCVPIGDTLKIARQVLPGVKKGATVVEISSVKANISPQLRKMTKESGVRMLSVHPMFGPSSTSRHPKIIVIADHQNIDVFRTLFPFAKLIPMGAREHDMLVAYTVSLVHLVNLAFVSCVSKSVGTKKFTTVAPPLGSVQLELAKAILSQDPFLYSYVDKVNPFVVQALSKMIRELQRFQVALAPSSSREFDTTFNSLSSMFTESEMTLALQKVYSISN